MTQEEKQLLLKDLCARLPYGVKVQYKGNVYDLKEMHKDGRTYLGSYNSIYGDWHCSLEFETYPMPYLRPMSNMTEEEKEYVEELSNFKATQNIVRDKVDFYFEHHLDYRGLIPMGLALEAPKDMYKIE